MAAQQIQRCHYATPQNTSSMLHASTMSEKDCQERWGLRRTKLSVRPNRSRVAQCPLPSVRQGHLLVVACRQGPPSPLVHHSGKDSGQAIPASNSSLPILFIWLVSCCWREGPAGWTPPQWHAAREEGPWWHTATHKWPCWPEERGMVPHGICWWSPHL